MRLNYFDYFRAIAILLIVAGHSYGPWAIDTLPEKVVANLITGGTALFVFISGFFFHHVFFPHFAYDNFLIKKTRNVFLPYIILSSIGFIFFVVIMDSPNPHLVGEHNGFADSMILYFKYFWSGRILTAYWYIPFIMIVFAISPIFIKYINLSTRNQVCIFTLLFVFSVMIHRPAYNLSPIHSVVYFTPIYLLGIIFSIHEKLILNYIKDKSVVLGLLTVSVSIAQILIHGSYENYHKKTMISYAGIDFMLIQKFFMIFFFLSVLQKIDNKEIALLKYIASVSFALFFLHPWFLWLYKYLSIGSYFSALPGIFIFPIKTFLMICMSLAVATLLKKIFRERSRYIIGW